jgi:hypothetical protein
MTDRNAEMTLAVPIGAESVNAGDWRGRRGPDRGDCGWASFRPGGRIVEQLGWNLESRKGFGPVGSFGWVGELSRKVEIFAVSDADHVAAADDRDEP